MKPTFSVQIPSNSYDVYIQKDLLKDLFWIESLTHKVVIITDTKVQKLYGNALLQGLKKHKQVELIAFAEGDLHKTRATKEWIEDELQKKQLNRDFTIIALGGGVVLDMAGFVAATYCRGVPFVSCPTTLLAMVDACIGGKTGVNTQYGKNRIGAFYHPKMILIDLAHLQTLSIPLLKEGLIEVIKHLLLFDAKGFERLCLDLDAILDGDIELLEPMIVKSCLHKKTIIEQDEKELSLRALLNFGHTIAHAIETLSSYEISHGRAVHFGILVESYFSFSKGMLSKTHLVKIQELMTKISFEKVPFYSLEAIQNALALDKKTKNQAVCIGLQEIGKYADKPIAFSEEELKQALNWAYAELSIK